MPLNKLHPQTPFFHCRVFHLAWGISQLHFSSSQKILSYSQLLPVQYENAKSKEYSSYPFSNMTRKSKKHTLSLMLASIRKSKIPTVIFLLSCDNLHFHLHSSLVPSFSNVQDSCNQTHNQIPFLSVKSLSILNRPV